MLIVQALMGAAGLAFKQALPIAVVVAASSNYLPDQQRGDLPFHRQKGAALLKGLLKFLLVASMLGLANVGGASTFYNLVSKIALWAIMIRVLVVFV